MSREHDARADAEHAEQRARSEDSRAPRRIPATEAARRAVEQLTSLLGTEPERVIGVEVRDSAWRVRLEVVELERIPETTSLMASYDVDIDPDGDLRGYQRIRRYVRGQIDGG